MKLQDVHSYLRNNVDPRVAKVIVELHKDISTQQLQITELVRIIAMLIDANNEVMKAVQSQATFNTQAIKDQVAKMGEKYAGIVDSEPAS